MKKYKRLILSLENLIFEAISIYEKRTYSARWLLSPSIFDNNISRIVQSYGEDRSYINCTFDLYCSTMLFNNLLSNG